MRIQWGRIVFLIVICLFMTGCWDAAEIDELAIVTASGLDLAKTQNDPSGMTAYLQIAIPSALGTTSGGTPSSTTGTTGTFSVSQGTGNDVVEALQAAMSKVSRKIILSHRRVMVLGEDFAKNGVGNIIDEIVRNPGSRMRTILLITYHNPASTIMKLPYPLERIPQEAVVGFVRESSKMEFTVKDFVEESEHGDPFTFGIEPMGFPEPSEDNGFVLQHIAVFQNEKLTGWLDGDDVDGFLWLRGIITSRYSSNQVPGHPGFVDTRMLTSRTIRKVTWAGGKPQVTIRAEANENIVENDTDLNLRKGSDIQLVEAAASKQIEDNMKSALTKLQQEYQADPIGLMDEIYRSNPRWWHSIQNHWREEYTKVPVQVQVEVHIRRSGLITPNV
ncbi:Ger(x)C family spore germination protein [Alicyclobacillus ferrooxydans]|uniref:Uncharacterized protein n=1 Tax=Alicyclobacillus ferrooxydans TaxID=471514 RepID=A0A0N8PNK7_9BACL|nr:Ger(x)C family spore germination protein [Alicyclobacillus ferrooxydans]KPV41797.1 hypothetical protein AN477_20395 [Alicyclobacillus ferrooxydans]